MRFIHIWFNFNYAGDIPLSSNNALAEIGKSSGWELALVTTPSNTNKPQVSETKMVTSYSSYPVPVCVFQHHLSYDTFKNTVYCCYLNCLLCHQAGGFDTLLLDSLYEDDSARRTLQLHSAGYSTYGYQPQAQNNPFEQQQHDPFAMSSSIAPPTNVQMALMSQQEQVMMQRQYPQQQQMMMPQQPHQQQQNMMMVPHNPYTVQYPQQQTGYSNPFGDPFSYPQTALPPPGNHQLI